MCGIAGIRHFDGAPVDERLLRRMAALLAHRGPDGEGVLVRGALGFAHRRLSIIDLAGSAQPMSDPDGRRHVCFNGEILNYRRLRAELPYPYRTAGDTEVLLAAHERYGDAAPRRLRGQFAYAWYDEPAGDLVLVRDPVGILPLYYYADARTFVFASEVKAVLAALPGAPAVDDDGLADYLTRRSVPAPGTLFRGVRKVPPGHLLRVAADGRVTAAAYWSVDDAVTDSRPDGDPEVVARVGAALDRAVARNLVADVPVGAYLSGGLDSSLVVALAARQRGRHEPVETFAAGFGAGPDDELPHARRVSTLFGTRHHEVAVRPADFAELWSRLTWQRDAPIGEASDVAVFRLAEAARERVKVVLSGEGSDELFAGYPKYRLAGLTARAGLVPPPARAAVLGRLERALPAGQARLRVAVRALAAGTAAERLEAWFAAFSRAEGAALVGRAGHPAVAPAVTPDGDPVRRMSAYDLAGYLPDLLLERADRMSMATSLEVRPPFLDLDVVELALALPARYKRRRGAGKWVVRQVARPLLPADIVDRRKVGFRVPLAEWFRGDLRAMAADRLLDPASFTARVFDRRQVEALLARHTGGRGAEQLRIWTLLSLEVWHDVFFGAGGPPPRPSAPAAPAATVVAGDRGAP